MSASQHNTEHKTHFYLSRIHGEHAFRYLSYNKSCFEVMGTQQTRDINSFGILFLYFSAARYHYDMYFSYEQLHTGSRIPGRPGLVDG